MNVAEQFSGKEVLVNRLVLQTEDGRPTLLLELTCEGKNYKILFEEVTRLTVAFHGCPFLIQGFEILDHSTDGWQSDARYEVRDYEEDSIAFYCEKITIV